MNQRQDRVPLSGRWPEYVSLLFILVLASPSAQAYIGPGAGISAIATVLALLGTIVVAIFGFVWFPLKRVLKRYRDRKAKDADSAAATGMSAELEPIPSDLPKIDHPIESKTNGTVS